MRRSSGNCGLRIADCGLRCRSRSVPRPSSLVPRPSSLVPRPCRGFTLVELLVAISILLILATITFTMVNVTTKGDQIRSAARQIQSYVEGARDRAIHANEPRGVRFLKDPNNQNNVNALIFVGSAGTYKSGTINISGSPSRVVTASPSLLEVWEDFYERGLIGNKIDSDAGRPPAAVPIQLGANRLPHTMVRVGAGDWRLTRDYGPAANVAYVLFLNPEVLPNQEPRLLPSGVVIDLWQCYLSNSLPPYWYGVTSNGGTGDDSTDSNTLRTSRSDDTVQFSSTMDVMFSPRGPVTGLLASAGNLNLLLSDVRDVERGLGAINASGQQEPNRAGDNLVVSITTQTGKISSHPVYFLTNAEVTNGDAADPFRYADLGEEAK